MLQPSHQLCGLLWSQIFHSTCLKFSLGFPHTLLFSSCPSGILARPSSAAASISFPAVLWFPSALAPWHRPIDCLAERGAETTRGFQVINKRCCSFLVKPLSGRQRDERNWSTWKQWAAFHIARDFHKLDYGSLAFSEEQHPLWKVLTLSRDLAVLLSSHHLQTFWRLLLVLAESHKHQEERKQIFQRLALLFCHSQFWRREILSSALYLST